MTQRAANDFAQQLFQAIQSRLEGLNAKSIITPRKKKYWIYDSQFEPSHTNIS